MPELGIELAEPVVIPNARRPDDLPPDRTAREPLSTGARSDVVAVSWSDNPRKGADVLAWLGRTARPGAGTSSPSSGVRRQGSSGWAVVDPVASSELAELLRAQDCYVAPSRRRSLLERAARGAGVRAPCALPAQRRPSRARRGGRGRVRRPRVSTGRSRPACRPARVVSAPRSLSHPSRTSPTGISRCSAGERGPRAAGAGPCRRAWAPRGCGREPGPPALGSSCSGTRSAGRSTTRPRTCRASPAVRATRSARRPGRASRASRSVFHTSHFAGARSAVAGVVPPPRPGVLPRPPGDARLPRVRQRLRGALPAARPLCAHPGDAPRDGRTRRVGRRRAVA